MHATRMLLGGAVLAIACTSAEPPAEAGHGMGPALDSPSKIAATEAEREAAPELGLGPLRPGAPEDARRDAVLAVLAGGPGLDALPVRATDPGKELDAGLGDRLTPRTPGPAGRLRQNPPEVEGAIHKDVVRRIIRAHMNEIRFCYGQVLATKPKADGEVGFAFTIDTAGIVDTAEISKNTLPDEDGTACFLKAAKRWKYPKSPDGAPTKVTWSVILTPD